MANTEIKTILASMTLALTAVAKVSLDAYSGKNGDDSQSRRDQVMRLLSQVAEKLETLPD